MIVLQTDVDLDINDLHNTVQRYVECIKEYGCAPNYFKEVIFQEAVKTFYGEDIFKQLEEANER